MTPQELNDDLERYLLDQMPQDERARLDARLAEDPTLSAQLARRQREHAVLQTIVRDHTRRQLQEWQALHPLRPSLFLKFRMAFLAALVLFSALFFRWALTPRKEELKVVPVSSGAPLPPTPAPTKAAPARNTSPADSQAINYHAIAAEFDTMPELPADWHCEGVTSQPLMADLASDSLNLPEPAAASPQSTSTALTFGMFLIDSICADLAAQHYSQALAKLSVIPADSPFYIDAQYFQGLAWFGQKAFSNAMPFLNAAASASDYLYAEQAEWYLALTYLNLGYLKSCKNLVGRIAAQAGHYKQQEAQALLVRLRR